jgi:hypothetical protein
VKTTQQAQRPYLTPEGEDVISLMSGCRAVCRACSLLNLLRSRDGSGRVERDAVLLLSHVRCVNETTGDCAHGIALGWCGAASSKKKSERRNS